MTDQSLRRARSSSHSGENMAEKDAETGFKKETVSKLLSSFFKEDKTRLSGDATLLMAEMLKIFVQEAAVRSQKQAETEDCDEVDIEHFEKILPQLLLDF
ncbi:centromere protein X [Sebastes umbrosus]|uniref:centromere protein X n=1 Tax=Sebastes umbrosus TaxID=72105 RepID=UPI00189CBF84|nr:centromere protein X [Sebastes umbrosus]